MAAVGEGTGQAALVGVVGGQRAGSTSRAIGHKVSSGETVECGVEVDGRQGHALQVEGAG